MGARLHERVRSITLILAKRFFRLWVLGTLFTDLAEDILINVNEYIQICI